MKTKLHFGILVILLAFLGTYLEKMTIPNQQIVIQFSDKDITEEVTENTIEAVKKQLQSIGVAHIQIIRSENGQFKIKYYSDSDVERIQKILSKEESLKIAYNFGEKGTTSFPENKSVKGYELNISEIQNSTHVDWDFERIEIVELNQKSDHSYNPKVNSSGDYSDIAESSNVTKAGVKVANSIAVVIEHRSYRIPEVRAGPSSREYII